MQRQTLGRVTKESFDFIKKLGDGAYGKVYLVKSLKNGQEYALKCVDKVHIIKHDKIESV